MIQYQYPNLGEQKSELQEETRRAFPPKAYFDPIEPLDDAKRITK